MRTGSRKQHLGVQQHRAPVRYGASGPPPSQSAWGAVGGARCRGSVLEAAERPLRCAVGPRGAT